MNSILHPDTFARVDNSSNISICIAYEILLKVGERMRFIDFFAGIGGFREGLERNGFECVGWCEWDKFKQQAYRTVHDTEGEWFADDITTVQPRDLPKADLYVGGFPCQSFSIAGKRGGFKDTRGTLFFEFMRLARERKPKYLLLENVKGLLSHNGGSTFGTILNTLWECGYNAEWQVLNSKDFGVPQNRERVFIIGYFRGQPRPKVFPIRGKNKKDIKQIGNIVDDSKINFKNPQRGRLYSVKGISPTLNCMQGGGLEPKILQEILNSTEEGDAYCIDANYHKGTSPGDINSGRRTHIKVKACLTPDRINKRQNGRRFKEEGEPSFTLTKQDVHGIVICEERTDEGLRTFKDNICGTLRTIDACGDKRILQEQAIRKLTPLECFRLQGFPDEWYYLCKKAGISDTQMYRAAGDSVTVNVVEEIGKRIKGR